MLTVDAQGYVRHPRVRLAINHNVEHGTMTSVSGIIVHQTNAPTAQSTLNSYGVAGAAGAHFLIDKDGSIYQTASAYQRTWHVGPMKARCLAEFRCTPAELKALARFDPRGEHRREMRKSVPDRYPSNYDSIGIELVGQAYPLQEPDPDKRTYETATGPQNASLGWLIHELALTLGVPMAEVHRHPEVSRKNRTEAASAQW